MSDRMGCCVCAHLLVCVMKLMMREHLASLLLLQPTSHTCIVHSARRCCRRFYGKCTYELLFDER